MPKPSCDINLKYLLVLWVFVHPKGLNIKVTLSQHGPAFGGAMEPAGHARAQSIQNFAIFYSSDVCANFREFLSIPSPSKMHWCPRIIIISTKSIGSSHFQCQGPLGPWHSTSKRGPCSLFWRHWQWRIDSKLKMTNWFVIVNLCKSANTNWFKFYFMLGIRHCEILLLLNMVDIFNMRNVKCGRIFLRWGHFSLISWRDM